MPYELFVGLCSHLRQSSISVVVLWHVGVVGFGGLVTRQGGAQEYWIWLQKETTPDSG